MPVRFRCAYCNQLMGISRRKVGTVVRCPKCSGQVVVPHAPEEPDDPPTQTNQGAVKALEDPELEALLAGAAREAAGLAKPKRKGVPKVDVEIIPAPATAPAPAVGTEPSSPVYSDTFAAPASSPTGNVTISLPRWAVGVAAAGAIVLLVLAFLLGRWTT